MHSIIIIFLIKASFEEGEKEENLKASGAPTTSRLTKRL
jgi:hypothetical protein